MTAPMSDMEILGMLAIVILPFAYIIARCWIDNEGH